ncbi:hypothetical protein J5N97_025096 [Dioscorea zingiberensis]|uniref:Uncharacterized protein n=1 Tax=Dioscorea zingiberensis TaxID=325984 RepID=A0A9D5H9C5_9LILI|nr:hypothetical protein J5N97_025096 [Dioscorea zingiberensis]
MDDKQKMGQRMVQEGLVQGKMLSEELDMEKDGCLEDNCQLVVYLYLSGLLEFLSCILHSCGFNDCWTTWDIFKNEDGA